LLAISAVLILLLVAFNALRASLPLPDAPADATTVNESGAAQRRVPKGDTLAMAATPLNPATLKCVVVLRWRRCCCLRIGVRACCAAAGQQQDFRFHQPSSPTLNPERPHHPQYNRRLVRSSTLHVSKPTWWLESRFHFSFADYYSRQRMGFGALRVVNDDLVKGNAGFGTHPHQDAEIFSYVSVWGWCGWGG